jgi:Family of unknown function (DUF6232)
MVQVTGSAVESGGRRWSLAQVDFVDVKEGVDLTLPFLELAAAAVLITFGIAVGFVGHSLPWAFVAGFPGMVLVGMAVHRGLAGDPLYALVLRRGEAEEVVCYSSDRHCIVRAAERVRAACV